MGRMSRHCARFHHGKFHGWTLRDTAQPSCRNKYHGECGAPIKYRRRDTCYTKDISLQINYCNISTHACTFHWSVICFFSSYIEEFVKSLEPYNPKRLADFEIIRILRRYCTRPGDYNIITNPLITKCVTIRPIITRYCIQLGSCMPRTHINNNIVYDLIPNSDQKEHKRLTFCRSYSR